MERKSREMILKAEFLADKIMNSAFERAPIDFPRRSGVYLIKHDKNGIIYVGKAKNLRRRICSDHLSAEEKDTTSAFRRSVHDRYKQEYGLKMKTWILNNCSFSYLEISDHDLYSLVEAILIAAYRSKELLNKPWLIQPV